MEANTEAYSRLAMQPTEEVVQCPSCDIALNLYDVAKHCEEEMERLKQMHVNLEADENKAQTDTVMDAQTENRSNESCRPRTIFRRVQKNRQLRLRLRNRKRPQEQSCPVCSAKFSQSDIQEHVEQCLRRNNIATDRQTNGNDSDEGSEEAVGGYEEYEWAGQKRVRASSLIDGGYASLGVGTIITNNNADNDDDEDLNVDEDDTQIYGPPQYNESNVIPPMMSTNGHDEDHIATYMRRLIAGNASADSDHCVAGRPQSPLSVANNDAGDDENDNIIDGVDMKPSAKDAGLVSNPIREIIADKDKRQRNNLQLIESLKGRLRHYENHIQNKFKCLICLDDYKNPAISVSCWHVHCEECWLRSLGSRKLCPQCNLITSPKDLRRIYL